MLNDKLAVFYSFVNDAVARHGMNARKVANEVIEKAFPDTCATARGEGADTMLRDGVVAFLAKHFKKKATAPEDQMTFEYPEFARSIVEKLKSQSHYVESLGEYVSVAMLIENPDWLDDARKYKRVKGQETIAEAKLLDELYEAVMSRAKRTAA